MSALCDAEFLDGVDYSSQYGASCPKCGETPVPRWHTLPWHRGIRVRRHKCPACGHAFKSTETDATQIRQ